MYNTRTRSGLIQHHYYLHSNIGQGLHLYKALVPYIKCTAAAAAALPPCRMPTQSRADGYMLVLLQAA